MNPFSPKSSYKIFLFINSFHSQWSLGSNLSDGITSLWTGELRGVLGWQDRTSLHKTSRWCPGTTKSPDRGWGRFRQLRSSWEANLGLGRSPAQQAMGTGQSGSPGIVSSLSNIPRRKGAAPGCTTAELDLSSAAKPSGREMLSYASTVSQTH